MSWESRRLPCSRYVRVSAGVVLVFAERGPNWRLSGCILTHSVPVSCFKKNKKKNKTNRYRSQTSVSGDVFRRALVTQQLRGCYLHIASSGVIMPPNKRMHARRGLQNTGVGAADQI